jgi:hypothetical protein
MSRRRDLLLVVAIAAAANFAYLHFSSGDFFYPDSFTYLAPAKSLAHARGFVDATGAAETMRTPLYPLLLVAFGLRVVPVIAFQHLLNIALAAGVWFLVRRRGGGRWTAIGAGVLCALDVPTIHYANKILTEATFAAVLFVIFALTLRATTRRALIIDGLLVGALVLIRPVAIAYVVVIAIFFAMQRVRGIVFFVIASLLLPGAWVIRNWRATGVATVSSIAGTNMLMYRGAGAMAMETDDDFAPALADAQQELLDHADEQLTDGMSHAARSVVYSRIGRAALREHPRGTLLLTLRGLLVNAFDSDWEAVMLVSTLHASIIQLALDAFTAILFAIALFGIASLWRTDRPLALLLALTVAYFLFIAAGGESEARFRVPVAPLLAIAAAHGLARRGYGAIDSISTNVPPSIR